MLGGLGLGSGLGLRLGLGVRFRVRVSVMVRVRVNSFRDSFSILLRAQHYSKLKPFGTITTAFYTL